MNQIKFICIIVLFLAVMFSSCKVDNNQSNIKNASSGLYTGQGYYTPTSSEIPVSKNSTSLPYNGNKYFTADGTPVNISKNWTKINIDLFKDEKVKFIDYTMSDNDEIFVAYTNKPDVVCFGLFDI